MNGTYTKTVDLAQVDPNQDNYKSHDADQITGLQDSLHQFGYVRRIVVQERPDGRFLLVAGHGVFSAAKLEQYDQLEMTVIPQDWPREKVNAYLVADNEHALASSTDETKLLKIIQEARDYDEGMAAAVGISSEKLQSLIRESSNGHSTADEEPQDAEPDLPEAERLQEKWRVKLGDIWQVGEHFVICGDCREPETWARLYAAAGIEKVQGVITSPPYAEQRKAQYGGVPASEYIQWFYDVQANIKSGLAADGSFLLNIKPYVEEGERSLYVLELVLALSRAGWKLIDEFSWITKGAPGEWPNRFKNWFEPVYHFSQTTACKFRPQNVTQEFETDPATLQIYGGENSQWESQAGSSFRGHGVKSQKYEGALPSNVLEIANRDVGSLAHSAAFPVALPAFFIKAFSDEGDVWLDPFAGSGSTLVACHRNGRVGLGMELLPKYVSVILERLLLVTEQPPTLIESLEDER